MISFTDQAGSRLVRADNGCLVWTGGRNRQGYGHLERGGRKMSTHRAAWIEQRGPIPNGLQIDHLCRNTSCAEVLHMDLVTRAENLRRARAAEDFACGHLKSEANTRWRYTPTVSRRCRACYNAAKRASRRRLAALRSIR